MKIAPYAALCTELFIVMEKLRSVQCLLLCASKQFSSALCAKKTG